MKIEVNPQISLFASSFLGCNFGLKLKHIKYMKAMSKTQNATT